jgi:RNA polymerase sigma-70 factor (ECF subfamily)
MIATMKRTGSKKMEFAENLRLHQTQLFGFIYSLVRDFNDADDLFQQTSLVLWRKFEEFDPARSFVAWACGVARFEVANFLRDRHRQRLYFSDDLSFLMIDVQAELEREHLEERRVALAECMKKLGERDQEILQNCYGGTDRIPEVARRWNRSTQSIHNTLRRIRRALYDCVLRTQESGRIG